MRGLSLREILSALLVPTPRVWLRGWESSPKGWLSISGKRVYLIGSLPCRKSEPEGEVVRTEAGTGVLPGVWSRAWSFASGSTLGLPWVGSHPVSWPALIGHPLFAGQLSASFVKRSGFRTLMPGMVPQSLPEMYSFVHSFIQWIIVVHLPSYIGDTMIDNTEWTLPSWDISSRQMHNYKYKVTKCVK